MNEDTLTLLSCHFDEVKDVLRRFITLIEENLTLDILPEERQIDDAQLLPLVLDLLS